MLRYDIFISYSRADGERVRPLVEELRRRGYRVFFDVESIVVGERWKERLERSIRASRVLVLCWSEHTRDSEYVHFEYSRAEGLCKPVLPWLLDKTPLPAMMEIQGITTADGVEAAAVLVPKLGWTLARRRMLEAVAVVLLLVAGSFAGWYLHRPPPPWEFRGEITDRQTRMPIPGVEVVVETGAGEKHSVYTDGHGAYVLRLPQPQPKSLHVLFRKEGYEAEPALNVSTSKAFDTDMAKLP